MFRIRRILPPVCAFPLILSCGGGGGSTSPDPNAVESVSVSPGNSTLASIGATTTLSASALNSSNNPISGKQFTWTSLSTNVAMVGTSSGVVTAVGPGTATIRATVNGTNVSGTAQVTVQQVVTSVAIVQPSASVVVGATVQLNANARDALGATVAGAPVVWSSQNSGIASVNQNTGVVTGVTVGSTMITATSGVYSASINVSVNTPPLIIAKDTTINGNVNVDGLSIAAGFTVTVDGPLTVRSTRLVSIAGTLVGNCQPFDIQGDTAVVINGTVNNGCAPGIPGVPLRISSTGELIIENAQIQSSGDITLTNNPSLGSLLGSGKGGGPGRAGIVQGAAGIPFTRVGNSTIRYFGGGTGPDPAPAGTNGANGGTGTNGRPVLFEVEGNAQFVGATLVWGQDGGAGGNGTNSSTANLTVSGGDGGRGGLLRMVIGGSLTYSGSNNILRTGAGGRGGNAVAVTEQNPLGTKAPNATTFGGDGGDPGLVEIEAAGGIVVSQPQAMVIEIGAPGVGGEATSVAANGMNAVGIKAAQAGGDATGRGGNGGSTAAATLVKVGNVTGSPPIVRGVAGSNVNGGRGGNANMTPGNGGNGDNPAKNGANGGGANGIGGTGGSSLLRGINNEPLGFGGDGGMTWIRNGNGGNGWNDCSTFIEPGGHAGHGGGMSGTGGAAGIGTLGNGTAGTVRFENASNGGKGGDGNIGGNIGLAGVKVVNGVEEAPVGNTFTNGAAPMLCPLQPNAAPAGHLFAALGGINHSNGVIGHGPHQLSLSTTPGGPVLTNSGVLLTTLSAAGVYYLGAGTPARIGDRNGQGWTVNLLSVDDNLSDPPAGLDVESFVICFLNANPAISPVNPLIVRQFDNFGKMLTEDVITAGVPPDGRPGCKAYPRFFNPMNGDEGAHVRWTRPTGGIEVDVIGFTIESTSPAPFGLSRWR